MSNLSRDEIMDYLSNAVISAREFCGNEREALSDAAFDLKIKLSTKGKAAAFALADSKWADFQKDAGIFNPINSHERNTINKIFEKAE